MEEKFRDEINFEYGDELYKKIFQIGELTDLEKERNSQLEKITTDFYQKVCPGLKKRYELKNLGLGYIEGYGYCAVSFQERGFYTLTLLHENFEEMYRWIIETLAGNVFWNYYSHNYEKLDRIAEKRFPTRIDNYRLLSAEFALKLLCKYFDNNIPIEFIKDYEGLLNYIDDYFYEYNHDVKRFIKKRR